MELSSLSSRLNKVLYLATRSMRMFLVVLTSPLWDKFELRERLLFSSSFCLVNCDQTASVKSIYLVHFEIFRSIRSLCLDLLLRLVSLERLLVFCSLSLRADPSSIES